MTQDEMYSRRLGGIANRLFHDSPMAYTVPFDKKRARKVAEQYRKELAQLIRELDN